MRKSTYFILYISFSILFLGLIIAHSLFARIKNESFLRSRAEMARQLELTDLSLFSEARYTRHLTQADLHTPFQDHPFSLEHFPSGSFVMPPSRIMRIHEPLD